MLKRTFAFVVAAALAGLASAQTARLEWTTLTTNTSIAPNQADTKVIADADGNFVVIGTYFDGATIATSTHTSAFVQMVEPNGTILWSDQITGPSASPNVRGDDVVVGSNGNIYAAGSGQVGFLARIASNGVIQARNYTLLPTPFATLGSDGTLYCLSRNSNSSAVWQTFDWTVVLYTLSPTGTLKATSAIWTEPRATNTESILGGRISFVGGVIYALGLIGPDASHLTESFVMRMSNTGLTYVSRTLLSQEATTDTTYTPHLMFDNNGAYTLARATPGGVVDVETHNDVTGVRQFDHAGLFDKWDTILVHGSHESISTAGPTVGPGAFLNFEGLINYTSLIYTYLGQAWAPGSIESSIIYTSSSGVIFRQVEESGGMSRVTQLTANQYAAGNSMATQAATGDTLAVGTETSGGTTAGRMIGIAQQPTLEPDSYAMSINSTLNGSSVLANDAYVTGLTAALARPVSTGTLVLHPDGTFVYTPPVNFAGAANFEYATKKAGLSTAVQTVTINVH